MTGEHLDLNSSPEPDSRSPGLPKARRFLGIHFTCCRVYTRIYINRDETAYVGYCPKCSKRVCLRIGPGGTDSRFFTVS